MKTAVVLLTLMLGLALAAGPANSPVAPQMATDNDPNAVSGRARSLTSMDDPPTIEWSFDCEFESVYNVGVTAVQDSLCWVSAGQATLKIGIYNIADPAHPFRSSFAQTGGPSGWGIRDMAYKSSTDEVFAGFDGQRFHVYNATTHVPNNTYTISGYTGTVRAMAYSPVEDSCWTGNFATSPMTKFSITGTNGHLVRAAAQMGSCYGLAFDSIQDCFWMTNAGAAGSSPTWKISYPGYTVTDSFNATGWDLGGGCDMWRDTFLLQLEQATPDMIWCMRFSIGGGPTHDVSLAQIKAPPAAMNPGSVTPKALIRNLGTSPEQGIPVTCWIDSAGTRVYNQTATYPGPLAPGAQDSIAMPTPWNSGPAGNAYNVTFFTALPGDEVPRNDTARQVTRISGAIVSDTIIFKRIPMFAPTIDGVIQPGEWTAAGCYDISDVAGRSGTPRPLGSAFMYFMYDDAFAYMAYDCPPQTARGDYDQFGPYVDENRSGTWSTDSSEGNHWVEVVGGQDSLVYRALLSTAPQVWRMPGQCPGCVSRSGVTSGHFQMEAKIPFGTRKGDWNVTPGDTIGFFQYTAQAPGNIYWGWWPQHLVMTNWANPAFYGFMWFDPALGTEESKPAAVPYALYRVANPVRNSASISYYLGRHSGVSLGVYDVSGQLVKTLETGAFEPGVRTVTWNRTADNGSRVANGTYFYRLTVDGKSVSAKAVVVE